MLTGWGWVRKSSDVSLYLILLIFISCYLQTNLRVFDLIGCQIFSLLHLSKWGLFESCMYCFDQETTDYARPIVFVVQVGLQDSDHGPVLDDGWPTVMRTEVREKMREHENQIKGWIFSFSFLKMCWSLASCLSGMAVTRTSAACLTWHCRARPTWRLGSRFTLFSASTHVCLLRQL